MREWAIHLQRFFTSSTRDHEALRLALESCGEPTIRAVLVNLPPKTQELFDKGQHLVAHLAHRGLGAEAAVLQLVNSLPAAAMADNALALPPGERHDFAAFLDGLTVTCRVETALLPSLAYMSTLKAKFCHLTGDLDSAHDAFEEAQSIFSKLAEADPQTSGLSPEIEVDWVEAVEFADEFCLGN